MNKSRPASQLSPLNWGAFKIAGIYLLLGIPWILFSDRLAERIALNRDMLASLNLYKGVGYVIVTAVLLYWLIQRYTSRLHASEKQLQVVINALPVLISYIDKNQHYQFANEAYEEWFGKKAQGKHIEEVVGTTIYQKTSKYVDKVLGGENITYETEIPFRDGGERCVSATYIPDIVENGQVKGFFTLVQDISEQKEAREKLRQWADAFEGCAHGIAIGDPDTNRVVVCNPAFANIHKCRVEDIVGTSFLSLYAPSDHEHVRRHFERADQIGHVHYEAQMVRRDGSTFPVEMDLFSVLGENGELLYRVTTMQDISERKRAEEVLHESEERYRIVSELTSDYAYKDRVEADGRIIPEWITESFTRITGYTLEETHALDFWQHLVHPEDTQILLEHIQAILSGQTHAMELRVIAKSGQVRWLRDYANPVWDADQERVTSLFGAVQDITEYKRAEEKLRLQAHSLDQINDAVISSDPNLVITAWNPAAERIYGWKAEEVIGKTGEEVLKTEFFSKTRPEALQEVRESGRFSAEISQLRKDGSRIHIETRTVALRNESGHSIGYLSVNRDISERKRAEENLRRFELLSEHSRDIILFMGYADGHILEANTAAVRAYGYSRDELLGLTIRDLHASDTQGLTADQMAQADAGGILFETSHCRKDGTIFPVEVNSQGATIGGVRTLISVVRDITERKQAEEQLEISNQKLNEILLSIQDDFYVLDRDWNFVYASRLFTAKVGKEPEDFVGNNIWKMFPKHVGTLLEENFRAAMEKRETRRFEIDGKYTSAQYRMTVFPSPEGITVLGTDITERKKAEEELQLKDELLRLTSEIAKVGGWEFDPATGKGTWTDEVARIHDLDPAQETNVEIGLSFYVGPSREKVEKAVQEVIELGKPYDLELEMRTAKGNQKWVRTMALPILSEGKVVKVQGIFQDITERKQVEDALQKAHNELELKVEERTAALSQANALLQALMDTMPDQIYFKDIQCRFIRNSRSQASLLGLNDPAQAIGKTDFDFFPHAAKAYAEEQEVMRSGKPLIDFEEWVVWPDGRESWVSTTKVPFRNSDGKTIGILGISRDITERKRAEQSIQQLNSDLEKQTAQLQASNKELEAFSYSVSHDLRAPLRAIDGYTRILVEDYEANLDAEGKRVCGVISAEARRMGQLIDDLLAFSRLGRKEMYSSNIDMKAMVVSILNELLKDEDRARIDFHIARLPSTSADSSLMRQVWVNLLSNAIKFTSKKERASIEVGSKSSREEIVYYVRDTGAGFDMEYANKLFGVFQRLHGESEFEGTGVGLAIVQRIIRRHDGRVWAEGEVDKGATFYFTLPRKETHHE
jgi:PAS domain S-box-containing protein